jgi:hypothetical protein
LGNRIAVGKDHDSPNQSHSPPRFADEDPRNKASGLQKQRQGLSHNVLVLSKNEGASTRPGFCSEIRATRLDIARTMVAGKALIL